MEWRQKSVRYKHLTIPMANIGLTLLWMWLFRGVFRYLGIIFTREEFRTNQILLVAILALIYLQIRKGEYQPRLDVLPQLYPPALALALGSSALYLVIERYLDINTFSASLFGLATYGLLGLWMRPRLWRSGLPAALLLIGALPFGEHLQTFIGYPVRLLSAQIVREGLLRIGVQEIGGQTIGVNTILVFESGITKVDLPCSGVKSLWTGALFLLAATWIERRRISLRWLLAGLGFVLLLLSANLARVAVLVLVGQVAGWRLWAEMLHVPLGVLGFVGACAAALVALRWTGAQDLPVVEPEQASSGVERPTWLFIFLAMSVFVMAFLYSPRIESALAESLPTWEFPADLLVDPWPMSKGETNWLAKAGIHSADRWRFQWHYSSAAQGLNQELSGLGPLENFTSNSRLSGSILLVSSRTWREHHRPEACLEVYGLTVDRSFSILVAPDFPVRALMLTDDQGHDRLTAVYWLQSQTNITEEYATRIWADLAPERQRWVLATILFDSQVDPSSVEVQAMYHAVRSGIQQNLEGGR